MQDLDITCGDSMGEKRILNDVGDVKQDPWLPTYVFHPNRHLSAFSVNTSMLIRSSLNSVYYSADFRVCSA